MLLLACGTSYHAGLVGKYIIEELLGIPVRVELGSEFNHRNRMILASMTIAITQSGETADVTHSAQKLKKLQAKTCVITNVLGSTGQQNSRPVYFHQSWSGNQRGSNQNFYRPADRTI